MNVDFRIVCTTKIQLIPFGQSACSRGNEECIKRRYDCDGITSDLLTNESTRATLSMCANGFSCSFSCRCSCAPAPQLGLIDNLPLLLVSHCSLACAAIVSLFDCCRFGGSCCSNCTLTRREGKSGFQLYPERGAQHALQLQCFPMYTCISRRYLRVNRCERRENSIKKRKKDTHTHTIFSSLLFFFSCATFSFVWSSVCVC